MPWPFPVITQKSRSLLPGDVTLICGAPGSAKSWWILSCLKYWTENNIKSAVLMLEKNKAWHLKRLLAQLEGSANILDSSWCRSNPLAVKSADAKHKALTDKVKRQLWCSGNLTLEACAEWVEARCKEGCRIICIDPITIAHRGSKDPWTADQTFMTRVMEAVTPAGASLVLSTHPKGVSGPNPSFTGADMAGGKIYDRASDSQLWLRSLETPTMTVVTNADGREESCEVHKVIRLTKTRNSNGQYSDICFRFNDLSFVEQGCAAKVISHKSSGASRFDRINSKPKPGEDIFQ
jgi:hypothetical protein